MEKYVSRSIILRQVEDFVAEGVLSRGGLKEASTSVQRSTVEEIMAIVKD